MSVLYVNLITRLGCRAAACHQQHQELEEVSTDRRHKLFKEN